MDGAIEEILEQGGYQRELPLAGDPESLPGGASGADLDESGAGSGGYRGLESDADGGRVRRPVAPRESTPGPRLPSSLATFLGLIVFGVVGLFFAIWLVRTIRDRRVDPRLRGEPGRISEPVDAAAVLDELPLEEAERLAAEGRFPEAIRALLHLTFQALRGREEVHLEPWLTSREVLEAARLSDAGRNSLAALVDAVEACLFARHQPERADFEHCASEYRALLQSVGGVARG